RGRCSHVLTRGVRGETRIVWTTRGALWIAVDNSCHVPREPAMERVWSLVAERLLWPLEVVELEVALDAASRFARRVVGVQVHLLVLQRAPQPLDEDVVDAAALAVHADLHAAPQQGPGEGVGRELRALVGVEDAG